MLMGVTGGRGLIGETHMHGGAFGHSLKYFGIL